MKTAKADILREYGPFPGAEKIGGVTYDGQYVWFASGEKLNALNPESGEIVQALDVHADAGTAFDGRYVYQIAEDRILKIDPRTGVVLSTIPAPGHGADSGLAWAEGMLWVGQHRARQIHQIDPETGVILHTVTSDRFVTGVTWVDGELWHGIWEGEQSEVRHVDAASGAVLECIELPAGTFVSGLESNGTDQFFCGGGLSGKIRTIRKPA
jgi:glutamine cyclotransferase